MANTFKLLVTLKTTHGRTGVQHYTGADSAPMVWDGDGDDETYNALIQLIDGRGEETDSFDMDGDDWRQFEDADGLAKVLRWISNPKFFGGLSNCVFAARMDCDPDGWSDAHEEVERLQALLTPNPTVMAELTRAIEHLIQAGVALRVANSRAGPVAGVLLIDLIGAVVRAQSSADRLAAALRHEEAGYA